ncbi:SMC-Scp complex subunit ScpB [Melissococcus plutonius]|nr:SMC-Scp complex subunit ScpB [Melissococcus plutonius]MCV2497897.1 SMC-Scp complex subunit ScpB [Melissococcus plutonius]MCV2500496.1 SMC-Scp complex subunit ScpB [Melissococcus plutonius]MCV2505236.1 SMC-Scp complex subunit ScpB [Melissococcus plutonius]MCV2506512.1 SMC-Scp complex subunit ScpB [Melissococcus plutonius]MCV2519166.1 SMC-Scp complex subunit ScpB [Melissococcus plutonius]
MTMLGQLEAILFIVGNAGISLEEISILLDISTAKAYENLLLLKQNYQENTNSALMILETGNHFMLSTKTKYAPLIKKYAQSPISNSLSQAALETVAIIAYKQPISRIEIDEIRGVQSAGPIQKLVICQLIEEKGRLDGPGRAILYGTTDYFMDYFGLKNLEELPDIQQIEEKFNEEIPMDLFFDQQRESTSLEKEH